MLRGPSRTLGDVLLLLLLDSDVPAGTLKEKLEGKKQAEQSKKFFFSKDKCIAKMRDTQMVILLFVIGEHDLQPTSYKC